MYCPSLELLQHRNYSTLMDRMKILACQRPMRSTGGFHIIPRRYPHMETIQMHAGLFVSSFAAAVG